MKYQKNLTVIGANQVWYEDDPMAKTLTELTAARGDIDVTRPLAIFGLFGKGFVVNETRLRVIDFGNTKLTSSTPLSVVPNRSTKLVQDQGSNKYAYLLIDYINPEKTSIYGYAYYDGGATAFDTTNPVKDEGGTTLLTPSSVVSPPHWYAWAPYGNGTSGSMPEQACIGCSYRGRAVLSGNPLYPYQWYMSRRGNPFDWSYAAADAQSPVAGTNADAGQCGDVVLALAPYQDDYLIFGCASSIWVMRGDPAAGGSLDQLSHTTGIYGATAFCWDGNHNFYFWGHSGIYRIAANLGTPELITAGRLPNIVSDANINPITHRITMAYDPLRIGILIGITEVESGNNSNYWYNLTTDGFFREQYPVQCAPYSMVYHNTSNPSDRNLLIGCTDGYIRCLDESAKDDDISGDPELPDTVPIQSRAIIGPGQIGALDEQGRIKTLTVVTGSDTDSVSVNVYAGNTAEEVSDAMVNSAAPLHSDILTSANRQQTFRPRTRGAWMGIVLNNSTASQTWSFERMSASVKPAGKL